MAHRRGEALPPLFLDGIRCWPFHLPLVPDALSAVDDMAQAARRHQANHRIAAARAGLNEDPFEEGTYVSGAPIENADDSFQTRFMYAFWRLCEQRIADEHRDEAGHAAKLAAQRADVSSEVRVVRLRRTEKPRSNAKDGTTEWHHRWVVKMHKVRQWYPSEQRHKVIYRGPYIKGPEDKPLLGGETVWALVR